MGLVWDIVPPLKGSYSVSDCRLRLGLPALLVCDDCSSSDTCTVHLDEEEIRIMSLYCTLHDTHDIDFLVTAAAPLSSTRHIRVKNELLELPSGRLALMKVKKDRECGLKLKFTVAESDMIENIEDVDSAMLSSSSFIEGPLWKAKMYFIHYTDGNDDDDEIHVREGVITIDFKSLDPAVGGYCIRLSIKSFIEILDKGLEIYVGEYVTREDIEDAIFILDYLSAHRVK